jgi:two-component sensor histidine kinase
MATEKVMNWGKRKGASEIPRRGLYLPWPLLAGQLGGGFKASSQNWTEFRVTFPKNQAK